MARTSSDEFELTWKPYGNRKGKRIKGGQWVKVIDGKQKSFGSASMKSDRQGYREALKKYRHFMDERETDQEVYAKIRKILGTSGPSHFSFMQWEKDHPGRDPFNPRYTYEEAAALREAQRQSSDDGPTLLDVQVLEDRKRRHQNILTHGYPFADAQGQTAKHAKTKKPTISNLVDQYLQEREQDRDLTRSNPQALASKQQLSEAGYNGIFQHLQTFKQFAGNRFFEDPREVESLLESYRATQVQKLIDNQYTAWTVNTKLAKLRTFIKWCVKKHHLDHEPANLTDVCATFSTRKSGQPLTMEQVRQLWEHAGERMRAWMAVSLNCGFYPVDVARLHRDHLVDGRIIQHRQKTHAQRNYKLWPLTIDLIERTCQDRDEDTGGLLWVTQQGNPLVQQNPNRNTLSHQLKRVCEQAGVKAT